jgi:excisionase family DNA binding protein
MGLDAVERWLTFDEVAELLGVSKGRVSRLVEEHQLFAKRIDREPKIPAELIVDGEPLASLRGTLILLLDAGLAVDEAVEWLYTEAEELGSTPMAALLSGKKAPVRRLAQTFAAS